MESINCFASRPTETSKRELIICYLCLWKIPGTVHWARLPGSLKERVFKYEIITAPNKILNKTMSSMDVEVKRNEQCRCSFSHRIRDLENCQHEAGKPLLPISSSTLYFILFVCRVKMVKTSLCLHFTV